MAKDDPDAMGLSLSARVARGAGWIVGGRFAMGALGFVNTIVIARILAPEDFGLVAIAITAMQLLANLSDIGVAQAVVRFRDADGRDLDTLFTLSAIRGTLISLMLVAAAPFADDFYADPRVFEVFLGAALYPLITGFSNPRFFEFERELDFSREFVALLANKLAGVAVSIAIAILWRSFWAIILGLVASGLVQLVLSYAMRPYRPRVSLASFRRIFGFSGWLTGVGFMAALNNKLDSLILARTIGTAGAGYYYMGQQLAELPTREIAAPITRAIYPGLAELQDERARVSEAFLRGVAALAAIAIPAALGFALIAADLVPLLIGEKWAPAVLVVAIVTPVMGLQTPLAATQAYAMALGLTRLVFIRELIFFLVRTPVFIWASVAFGLAGAALAVAACGILHIGLNLALYARVSGDLWARPLWRARRSIAASAAMVAAVLGMRALLAPDEPIVRIACEIALGALVYFGAHWALWRLSGAPDGAERTLLDIARGIIAGLKPRIRTVPATRHGEG